MFWIRFNYNKPCVSYTMEAHLSRITGNVPFCLRRQREYLPPFVLFLQARSAVFGGVEQRSAAREHCCTTFEPSSMTWSSARPWGQDPSSGVALRQVRHRTCSPWSPPVKRCNSFIIGDIFQKLFSKKNPKQTNKQKTGFVPTRMHKHARTRFVRRRSSPLRIRPKTPVLFPFSSGGFEASGCLLFALLPLQTKVPRACRPLCSISRRRHTSKSSPIWVVRLYLLMLLWDTKLNSNVLFDMHNERLLAAHRIMSLSDSRDDGCI